MEKIILTKQAQKDFDKIKQYPALEEKVDALITLILDNPFACPPSYEKLLGFENVYSRRINLHHRLVYEVFEKEKIVRIIRMWSHYE